MRGKTPWHSFIICRVPAIAVHYWLGSPSFTLLLYCPEKLREVMMGPFYALVVTKRNWYFAMFLTVNWTVIETLAYCSCKEFFFPWLLIFHLTSKLYWDNHAEGHQLRFYHMLLLRNLLVINHRLSYPGGPSKCSHYESIYQVFSLPSCLSDTLFLIHWTSHAPWTELCTGDLETSKLLR